MYRQTRWALNFSLFSEKVNGEFVLRACSCCCVCRTVAGAVLAVCCRCLVVGMVAAVAIVVSVAVDEAGGESVRNMFVQRGAGGGRSTCGRCTCRRRPRCPRLEAAAVDAVLTVVIVVPVVFAGLPRTVRDTLAFCCSGPEGGDCGP